MRKFKVLTCVLLLLALSTVFIKPICVDADDADNTKELRAILLFIAEYDTEKEWQDNYDYLYDFVNRAQNIISLGTYDASYLNLSDLLRAFLPMQQYFAQAQRMDHINYLEGQMQRYNESDEYFEKFGITVSIAAYLEKNNIDTTVSPYLEIFAQNNENKIKLAAEEEKYEKLLRDNAEKFVDICIDLGHLSVFNEKLALIEEAEKYLYCMDVSYPGVMASITVLENKKDLLEDELCLAEDFIKLSLLISQSENEELLLYLVEGNFAYKTIDSTIPGIEEAKERYDLAKSRYNESVDAVNSELAFTTDAAINLIAHNSGIKMCAYAKMLLE